MRNDQPWELYNLDQDVGETVDLAKELPSKVKELAKLVEQARVPIREQSEPKHPIGQRFN